MSKNDLGRWAKLISDMGENQDLNFIRKDLAHRILRVGLVISLASTELEDNKLPEKEIVNALVKAQEELEHLISKIEKMK